MALLWNNHRNISRLSDVSILDLDSVKSHLRVDFADDDALIQDLIDEVYDYLDGPNGIGVPLLTQQWEASFEAFPWYGLGLILPLFPVVSIDSFKYTDMFGNIQTLDPSIYDYDLNRNPVQVGRAYNQSFPASLPIQRSVMITYTCGFGDTPDAIPRDLRRAMKLIIGHWYENREGVVGIGSRDSPMDVPQGIDAILNKYRVLTYA